MSTKNKKDKPQKGKNKKDAKGKAKDMKQEIKLTRVEETFYRLTVADCEKKLQNIKHHLQSIDENNASITEQIRSLNEDKIDEAADMTRKVDDANEQIYELNERLYVLSHEYFEVKQAGDATIADLEEKFRQMHNQLLSEVKILKAHLNIIEEYPRIEQKLLYINELEELDRAQKEAEAKELIQATERRIKGERETMRKEIEQSLLHVSEEFTRNSALRNAAYTSRLIRENIALQKEINILDSTWRATDQQLKEQVAHHKKVKATFPALNEKKKELIMIAQQKTQLIDQLTSKYEKIKAAYVESLLYKTQYEELVKNQSCKHFQRKELMDKAKKLGRNAHQLKTTCLHLESDYEKNNLEIDKMKAFIGLIRETVLKAIGLLDEQPRKKKRTTRMAENLLGEEFENEEEEERNLESAHQADDDVTEEDELSEEQEKQNLLETLVNILNFYSLNKISTPSVQTLSCDHLLRQHSELIEKSSDSLREAFKHGAASSSDSSSRETVVVTPVHQLDEKIPTERLERCPLFDVEKGSTLYVSEADSRAEPKSVEEQAPDEQDENVASSSSEDVRAETAEEAPEVADAVVDAPTTEKKISKLSLSEMPAGTILDVEMLDEEEEEEEPTEFDQDVYLADRDNVGDNVFDTDAGNEGEEEEMPIYMFY